MNTVTTKLYYKAQFNVSQNGDTGTLHDNVLMFVYDYIMSIAGLPVTFEQFLTQRIYETFDHALRMEIALQPAEPPVNERIWSVMVRKNDETVSRRSWVTHVNIRYTEGADNLPVMFAEFCQDYTRHSFGHFPAPVLDTPPFVTKLLRDNVLFCAVCGYPFPYAAIRLDNQMANVFLDLLFHPDRKAPLVVITCPEAVDPGQAAEATLANAIVFYSLDSGVIARINGKLPDYLRIAPDAVQTYHGRKNGIISMRVMLTETIQRIGGAGIALSLRRAYCECMSHEERRAFKTTGDIVEMNLRREKHGLAEKSAELQAQNDAQLQEIERLRAEKRQLQADVERLQRIAGSDAYAEACEYEAAWTRCQHAMDGQNAQITKIAASLFTAGKPELDAHPASAEIGILLEALKFITSTRAHGSKP
jgi:hypothetical protein